VREVGGRCERKLQERHEMQERQRGTVGLWRESSGDDGDGRLRNVLLIMGLGKRGKRG
jgi:hypothetical protein